MINDWIVRLSPWAVGLAAVGFALTLWAAVRAFWTTRTGAYYIVREQARRRGWRLVGVAALLLIVGIGMGGYTLTMQQRARITPVAASVTPSATPLALTSSPTPTLSPTPAPTATCTPRPPTLTPTPTRLPLAELPPTLLTPLPLAVTARPDASFGSVTFAAGPKEAKCASLPPAQNQPRFEAGAPKVCAYFSVRNMARNTTWTAAWYLDGKYVAGDPLLWDGPANGIGIAFFAEPGRRPGRWELKLFIEDRLQSTGVFTVTAPAASPAPTSTATPAG